MNSESLIRARELRAMTGLSRVTVWRLERAGLFPPRVRVGARSVAWRRGEVEAWVRSRPRASNGAP
ncbi:MAG: AlpA family phage regulatory protein [Gammaproteobacteria bacterium]|nr:AlpA family phage regulatory protein [Gammaproteobacteria bacterium]